MPFSAYFSLRFVFDEHFYNIVLKKHPGTLKKLMYINSNARGHKRTFNVLSKKIFQKILSNNTSMPRSLLRSSFYDIEEEELEKIEDEIERVVKYAIHVIEEDPHKSCILTSDNKVEEYERSPHYRGVKEIYVKGGQEALNLIEQYWKDCSVR